MHHSVHESILRPRLDHFGIEVVAIDLIHVGRARCFRGTLHQAQQAATAASFGRSHLHQIPDRRRDVATAHSGLDHTLGYARARDDERCVHLLLVENAVVLPAVIAQAFAVIRHDHHDGVVELAAFLQALQHATKLLVHVRHLGSVQFARRQQQPVRIARQVGWQRLRGRQLDWVMRIPVMQPQEERALVARQLIDHKIRGLVATALQGLQIPRNRARAAGRHHAIETFKTFEAAGKAKEPRDWKG